MSGMTPSAFQQQLENRGIAVHPDHVVWMTARIESAGKNPPTFGTK